jgi:hypothetical protein
VHFGGFHDRSAPGAAAERPEEQGKEGTHGGCGVQGGTARYVVIRR